MVLITIVTGAYKPTDNYGAPHCRDVIEISWGFHVDSGIGIYVQTKPYVFSLFLFLGMLGFASKKNENHKPSNPLESDEIYHSYLIMFF